MTRKTDVAQQVLQGVFSVFIGIIVTALVALGTRVFLPAPTYDYSDDGSVPAAAQQHALIVALVAMAVATALLAGAVWLGTRIAVISNGMLMGGLFVMVMAVVQLTGMSTTPLAFAIVTVGLAICVVAGFLRFTRRTPAASMPAGAVGAADDELAVRVEAIEQKLDAITRALAG